MNNNIPEQLENWRLLPLCRLGKIPIAETEGWTKDRENKTYRHDSLKLKMHIANSGNYGVCCDTDRFVVACDTKAVEQAVENGLPKTFSVRSPRHRTKHFYFYGSITKSIMCKASAEGDPCADIKHGNAYVVGPNSTYGSYGKYEVVDDVPIATITEEALTAAISDFILSKKVKKSKASCEIILKHPELNFPITKITDNLENLIETNSSELRGPHPIHGSTTGVNFVVNIEKNVWYCFRSGHECGGGPLELIAVLYNIANCEDIQHGLRGKNFVDAVHKAEELGYIKPFNFEVAKDVEPNDMKAILEKMESLFIFKTPTDLEEIYRYKDGLYVEAQYEIEGLLEKMLGAKCTTNIVNEVLNHIRRRSYVDRDEFNKKSEILPVKNGLLNLKTLKLQPFTPDKIFTFKINVNFDLTKKCPEFEAWLQQVLPEKEDVTTLQEYSGYCLLPSMPFHRSMWFVGNGRNGKGTFIKTLEAILNKQNCAYISIMAFNGQRTFVESLLYGKLINVSSEPATHKQLQTSLFKKFTGGDYVEGEVKNKQKRLGYNPFAKWFILGNRYPQVNDNTIAFWERILLISWTQTFIEGQNQTQNIEKKWTENSDELSGILNWMIIGLQNLLANKGFTISKSQKEIKIEFQRASDPPSAWLEENCVFDTAKYIVKTEAFDNYKDYCDENNLFVDEKKFYGKMKTTPKIKTSQKEIKGKRVRIYEGITLKTQEGAEKTDGEGADKADPQQKLGETPSNNEDSIVSAQLAQDTQGKKIMSKNEVSVGEKYKTPVYPVQPVQETEEPKQFTYCFICNRVILAPRNDWLDKKPCHFSCLKKYKEGLKKNE